MSGNDDPSGYASAVIDLRAAVDRFEHEAAMVASGHAQNLPAAADTARAAVIAARSLSAWCERMEWRIA